MTSSSSNGGGTGQQDSGQGIVSFVTALGVSVLIFAVQLSLFLLLRNKLARIFKPKTYLVPERERTGAPPIEFFGLINNVINFRDREVIQKCGLDAFFFLRYLRTMLVIFVPICFVVLPVLIPINFAGGKGQNIGASSNITSSGNTTNVVGLDVLSWGNVRATNTHRYIAHLIMGILVIVWICGVFFFEMKVYIKVRQDYLTRAEHRLRASATTVLVNTIPQKWLSEEALRGLFDVFPGGVRNVWLNRDLSQLLDKVNRRDKVHKKLESAETDLIRNAKKAELKRQESEEKKRRRKLRLNPLSKNEKVARDAEQDAEAKRLAQSSEGTTSGDTHDTPHTVAEGLEESRHDQHETGHDDDQETGRERQDSKGRQIPIFGDSLAKVGTGVFGAMSKASQGVEETLGTANGFVGLDSSKDSALRSSVQNGRRVNFSDLPDENRPSSTTETLDHAPSAVSADSTKAIKKTSSMPEAAGNTVRKIDNIEDMYLNSERKFWEFWKPPSGSYASPVPQGYLPQGKDDKKPGEEKSGWKSVKSSMPFMGGVELTPLEYPPAYNEDYNEEDDGPAEWEKYLRKKDRPTHHLSLFGVMSLPGIPLINKKVDTIEWCREELARLNVEIDLEQKYPERYPLMTSAFIQFNNQVAAHMACQSVIHHVPKQMSPRMVEIAPRDVIWENMALSWWQEWMRTIIVTIIICGMIFLWAIPVAWTAAISQVNKLIANNDWLHFLTENAILETAVKAIAGVLPALLLSILLYLVPMVLSIFASFKGAKTGAQKTEFVQVFYFVFLFVQVFLVVSIASFFAASLNTLVNNIAALNSVTAVLDLLATNLPSAANYFFSYMILQAMSTSSGTLLQITALLMWFVIGRMLDSTARNKWSRNTKLSSVTWGTFFPVYTNFACIGIIYSVIAPLISIFNVVTFSLLWVALRYAMIYVIRFENDTGGVLYPRAINQTFTGIYFMELCMIGLFFIVEDQHGHHTCTAHAIIMIVVLILTVIYQFFLNYTFSPLFRYLPVTFEDEAVIRDEAFQRAQDRRLGFIDDDGEGSEAGTAGSRGDGSPQKGDIELQTLENGQDSIGHTLANPVKKLGNWAKDGGNQLRKLATANNAVEYRQIQRRKDLEAQRAIGEALFGGFSDEIEDLTPEERDALTRHAFQHAALRSRRPTVWIPRDDLGISDDEIRRTQAYSEHIWISNEGTALDSKARVVYGKNPPDFSELDIIDL